MADPRTEVTFQEKARATYPWVDGFHAYNDGLPVLGSPYGSRAASKLWEDGWRHAFRCAMERGEHV